MPFSLIRYAIRCVSARVLPDPAPATMRTGPSVWRTASFWTGFSPARRGDWDTSDATDVILGRPGVTRPREDLGLLHPLGPPFRRREWRGEIVRLPGHPSIAELQD